MLMVMVMVMVMEKLIVVMVINLTIVQGKDGQCQWINGDYRLQVKTIKMTTLEGKHL
jgi:hypothetical protein